jgi:hypothetical protein
MRVGVQADRLSLLLGGLAGSADEPLDVGLVLPLRGKGRFLGHRGSLDQFGEVIDRCHGSSSGSESDRFATTLGSTPGVPVDAVEVETSAG